MKLRFESVMKSRVFTDPLRKIIDNSTILDNYMIRLENSVEKIQKERHNNYAELITKLDTLSPLKTLSRGYNLAEKDGKIVKSVYQLEKDEVVKLKFIDGNRDVKVL